MEKRKPHCKLDRVKELIAQEKVMATRTALTHAAMLDCDFGAMLQVIQQLTPADFYKSMTTHADYTIWQDVYKPSTAYGDLYIKLTVIDDVLIVSFKEL